MVFYQDLKFLKFLRSSFIFSLLCNLSVLLYYVTFLELYVRIIVFQELIFVNMFIMYVRPHVRKMYDVRKST